MKDIVLNPLTLPSLSLESLSVVTCSRVIVAKSVLDLEHSQAPAMLLSFRCGFFHVMHNRVLSLGYAQFHDPDIGGLTQGSATICDGCILESRERRSESALRCARNLKTVVGSFTVRVVRYASDADTPEIFEMPS